MSERELWFQYQQLFHAPHDLRGRNPQDGSDSDDFANGRAVDASFNQTDISPVEASLQCKPLLGDSLALADLPECLAEGFIRSRFWLDLFAS